MPNTNTGHEARGLQAACGEIGADHGDQRHNGRIFGEHRPAFMCNQERGEVAKRNAGGDADHGLLDEIEQRTAKREVTAAGCDRQHGKGQDRGHGVVERGFGHHGLGDAL